MTSYEEGIAIREEREPRNLVKLPHGLLQKEIIIRYYLSRDNVQVASQID